MLQWDGPEAGEVGEVQRKLEMWLVTFHEA